MDGRGTAESIFTLNVPFGSALQNEWRIGASGVLHTQGLKYFPVQEVPEALVGSSFDYLGQ
jgi:hypothetical protein